MNDVLHWVKVFHLSWEGTTALSKIAFLTKFLKDDKNQI